VDEAKMFTSLVDLCYEKASMLSRVQTLIETGKRHDPSPWRGISSLHDAQLGPLSPLSRHWATRHKMGEREWCAKFRGRI